MPTSTHASPEQIAQMKKLGVIVEANIGSNMATGVITELSQHPLLELLYHEVPTIINTDAGSVMKTDMAREYKTAEAIIQEFKEGKRTVRVDGEDLSWSGLSRPERKRFDTRHLKKAAEAYRELIDAHSKGIPFARITPPREDDE